MLGTPRADCAARSSRRSPPCVSLCRLSNPVAHAENSPGCPRSDRGERMLPNGTEWRPQLLMLCFTTKVLTDSNNVLKPGELLVT